MKTTIFKYNTLGLTGLVYNYFSGLLQFTDKFVTERHLKSSFPIFVEEYTSEDDIIQPKTGYFDMKLSFLMTERSQNGDSVKEFFCNGTEDINNYKYLVICETGNPGRVYSGMIGNTEIKFHESVIDNLHDVTFSTYGIEKEAVDWIKTLTVSKTNGDIDFESQYLPHHFSQLGLFIWMESELDINNKIGSFLNISRSVQNDVINAHPNGFSCWEGFKSFFLGFQFRFRVKFYDFFVNNPRFVLKLYWRSEGINHISSLKVIRNVESSFSLEGSKWVFIPYTSRAVGNATQYTGFFVGSSNIYYFVGGANAEYTHYYSEGDFYQIGNFRLPGEFVKKIDLQQLSIGYSVNFAYCNMAYTSDYNLKKVWQYIANVEMNYLIESFRIKRLLNLKVADDSSIVLGSIAELDDRSFVCERISSFDNYNRTMETEWMGV